MKASRPTRQKGEGRVSETQPELDERLEREVRQLFRARTGYDPENCPSEIEAEMMYEIEDSDD